MYSSSAEVHKKVHIYKIVLTLHSVVLQKQHENLAYIIQTQVQYTGAVMEKRNRNRNKKEVIKIYRYVVRLKNNTVM